MQEIPDLKVTMFLENLDKQTLAGKLTEALEMVKKENGRAIKITYDKADDGEYWEIHGEAL